MTSASLQTHKFMHIPAVNSRMLGCSVMTGIHNKFHENEETRSKIKMRKTHKQNGSLINLAVYFKKEKYTRNRNNHM
jgi:hypothetical protein